MHVYAITEGIRKRQGVQKGALVEIVYSVSTYAGTVMRGATPVESPGRAFLRPQKSREPTGCNPGVSADHPRRLDLFCQRRRAAGSHQSLIERQDRRKDHRSPNVLP